MPNGGLTSATGVGEPAGAKVLVNAGYNGPPVTPPVTGVNKAHPFASTSPWNTPTLSSATWTDNPLIRNNTAGNYWWVGDAAFGIYWSSPSDPVWTFTLPAFNPGSTWNRQGAAEVVTMKAPANVTAGGDTDAIVCVADPTTGEYVEIWQAIVDQGARTVTTAAGKNCAHRNCLTGSGFGSLAAPYQAGVRASNAAWLGGALTGTDWDQGAINHALAIALFDTQLQFGAPTPYAAPATCGDNSFAAAGGNILMGSRIGIPSDSVLVASGTSQATIDAAKTLLATPILDANGVSRVPGTMLWNCLQTYGGIVVDRTGGTSQFYADYNSKRAGYPGNRGAVGSDPTSFDPFFTSWGNWYGSGESAMTVIRPFLRITTNG